jgi:hypothetical protein
MQQNAQAVDAGAKLVVRACYDVMCFDCYSIVCLGNLNFALLNQKNTGCKTWIDTIHKLSVSSCRILLKFAR